MPTREQPLREGKMGQKDENHEETFCYKQAGKNNKTLARKGCARDDPATDYRACTL